MKSVFISNEYNVVQGMKLSGIESEHSSNTETLRGIFKKHLKSGETGIIILTEDTETLLSDLIISHREKGGFPLIVTIPGENGLKDKNFII